MQVKRRIDLPTVDIFEFLNSVFLGDVSEAIWLFAPVAVLRVIILYMFGFFLLRLMGKRENRQITMFDAVVIVSLGNLIGTPTIDLQLPLIVAMIALSTFLLLEQGFIVVIQRSRRLEELIESEPALLIEDSKVNSKILRKEKLGTNELYSRLRLQGISNLGQVEKAYLEGSGDISLFKKDKPTRGLSIFPIGQGAPQHYKVGQEVKETEEYACWKCGETRTFGEGTRFTSCRRCNGKEWVAPDNHT